MAWLLCAAIIVTALYGLGRGILDGTLSDTFVFGNAFMLALLQITFALVGALILSRQSRNVIGWLLILPALAFAATNLTALVIGSATTPPESISLWLYVALYVNGASWAFLIFPLFLIALLFPNGKPVSPRWRWVVGYAVGMLMFFLVLASLAAQLSSDPDVEGAWAIPNPIGFITQDMFDVIFGLPWGIALSALAVLSAVSLFLRYRRAASMERQQLKWLLFGVSLFAMVYIPGALASGNFQGFSQVIWNFLLWFVILIIPVTIGIAILRYRLFDIDILIRRTVTYAIVVALLLIVYFGSVILLQQIFANLTGLGSNEIVTVLSTLAIAALFVPLRNRIQDAIDKRFNRKKYDAQKVMEKFSQTVRDETDIDKLTAELVNVVNETMQPRSVSVWLRREERSK